MAITIPEQDWEIIKRIELELAVQIKEICERNAIHYSIVGGTLIGAVRHGGFIPWDDDIDISMTRPNYDRFLAAAQRELDSEKYMLVNYETSDCFGEPFTKLMRKNTVMRERFIGNSGSPCGVFVDIFPIDNTTENPLLRAVHRYKNYSLRKRILLKSGYDFGKTGVEKMLYRLIELTTLSDKQTLKKRYRKNMLRFDGKPAQNTVSMCGFYGYDKEIVPAAMLEKYTKLTFEGVKFEAFAQYDAFLRHYFSDYMQLPPESERVRKHSIVALDISIYGGSVIGAAEKGTRQ